MDPLRIALPPELFVPAAYEHLEGEVEIPLMKAGPDLYDFSGPLPWQVDISNTGDAILVTGEVRGEARTACARCLKPFSFPVVGEVEGYFLIEPESETPDQMEEDEFDVLPDDRTIDLAPLIQAALLLEFPLVPLHDDDCRGLCPSCGADLNEGPCTCAKDASQEQEDDGVSANNPFAVLKNYEFGE